MLLRIARFNLGSACRHWHIVICMHNAVLNPTPTLMDQAGTYTSAYYVLSKKSAIGDSDNAEASRCQVPMIVILQLSPEGTHMLLLAGTGNARCKIFGYHYWSNYKYQSKHNKKHQFKTTTKQKWMGKDSYDIPSPDCMNDFPDPHCWEISPSQ